MEPLDALFRSVGLPRALPVVAGDDPEFHHLSSGRRIGALSRDAMGIRSPLYGAGVVALWDCPLILVPGLAFDPREGGWTWNGTSKTGRWGGARRAGGKAPSVALGLKVPVLPWVRQGAEDVLVGALDTPSGLTPWVQEAPEGSGPWGLFPRGHRGSIAYLSEQIPKLHPPPPFTFPKGNACVRSLLRVGGCRPQGRGHRVAHAGAPAASGEDFGYNAFFETVDTLVMGRHTFETAPWFSGWPYERKRLVVRSPSLRGEDLPSDLATRVTVHLGSIPDLMDALRALEALHVFVDGGQTIQAFLAEGLLETLILTRVPILLVSGITLFWDAGRDLPPRHVETLTFSNGLVQDRYGVAG